MTKPITNCLQIDKNDDTDEELTTFLWWYLLIAVPNPDDDSASPNDPLQSLDLSAVHFPSDQLSIGDLRKLFPDNFDIGFSPEVPQPSFFVVDSGRSMAQVLVGEVLETERLIVIHAMLKAQGKEREFLDRYFAEEAMWEDAQSSLVDRYTRLGIASGPKHADELIRSLEKQGRALSGIDRSGLN